jgi:hypothetical protein
LSRKLGLPPDLRVEKPGWNVHKIHDRFSQGALMRPKSLAGTARETRLRYIINLKEGDKMAEKKPKQIMVPQGGGTIHDLVMRLKLIVRLMGDKRVSPYLKLLPIASLVYLVSPGVSALDDMAIVSLGAYLFVEFCPPDVVQEHMKKLTGNTNITVDDGDIVDGQATDMDENDK